MNIQNKVAIVTGGCSGLGLATATMLSEQGAHVHVFDIQEKSEALERLHAVTYHQVDVTNEEHVQKAIDAIIIADQALHICINCAGIAPAAKVYGKSGVMSLDLFKKTVEINLIGTFNVLRLAIEKMVLNEVVDGQDKGVVINTASIAAFEGQIGQAAYAASKGGVASLALPLARDLARENIRVNTIAPGLFETPMMAGMPEKALQSLQNMPEYPKRLGLPEDYAFTVKYLIESTYVNAECIRLDAATRLPAK